MNDMLTKRLTKALSTWEEFDGVGFESALCTYAIYMTPLQLRLLAEKLEKLGDTYEADARRLAEAAHPSAQVFDFPPSFSIIREGPDCGC